MITQELMVFDWEKAAEIIRDRKPQFAVAGLYGDYAYTSGVIWQNGKIATAEFTYLASKYAKPMLILDYEEAIECYKMESETPGWDAYTRWPEAARLIVMEGGST